MVFALSCSHTWNARYSSAARWHPGIVLARENRHGWGGRSTNARHSGGNPSPTSPSGCSITLRNDRVSPKYICKVRGRRKGPSWTSHSEEDSRELRVPASTS